MIQETVNEEGERLVLSVKFVETGGLSLRSQLVRTDLTGCLMTDCGLFESGAGSGSHTRRGCVYSGTCKECEEVGTTAKYFGESVRSGYHQFKEVTRDIKANNPKNAFCVFAQSPLSAALHCTKGGTNIEIDYSYSYYKNYYSQLLFSFI